MSKTPTEAAGRPRVDGLYELGHVLHVLDAEVHGFARDDIEGVERFWTFGDLHCSAAGFVLALRGGRRAHIDFQHWHAFEQDEDFRIEVSFLDGEPPAPAFGDWSDATSHLNRALAHS